MSTPLGFGPEAKNFTDLAPRSGKNAISSPTIARLLAESIDHLSDAILLTEGETTKGPDGQRRILFVNDAYVRMTGFSREEAIGETPGITIGPASDRKVLQELDRARRELRPIRIELLKYRKDLTTFWTELDVVPLFDEAGKNSHFLGVLRDITDRKLLQARLTEADRLAAIGTLAAGIAHEINNPLSYVLMNLVHAIEQLPVRTHLLAATSQIRDQISRHEDELRANLTEALRGAERVRRIVSDIKMFSREEPSRAKPVEIVPILDGALQLAQRELSQRATVIREYGDSLPVLGDSTRLGQVVLNLLLNAAQSIHEGEPEKNSVTIALFTELETGESGAQTNVCIEVRDSGPGIAPDILPRVFDPFFTTKAVGEGTGLGLSICHGIVTALGGTIRIQSALKRGTTVRVTLPATDPALHAEALSDAIPTPPAPRRQRVLIIDDEPTVANALRRVLSREHDVSAVFAAEEALGLLENGAEFDTILCDLMMPGISGMDLYELLQKRAPELAQRMVFMTGGAYTRAARAFIEVPHRTILDKPFDIEAVRKILQRSVG